MAVQTLVPELRYVEDAHGVLGLTYRQIAAALGADESTLHRWRAGESEPRRVLRARMESLGELQAELLATVQPAAAQAWLQAPVPGLDGQRPIDVLERGRIEPLTRLLMRLNAGIST